MHIEFCYGKKFYTQLKEQLKHTVYKNYTKNEYTHLCTSTNQQKNETVQLIYLLITT